METLRRNLQSALRARGLKPRKASELAGLNPNAIGTMLSRAKHEPRLSSLVALADFFEWPLERVVYWAVDRPEPTSWGADLESALRGYGLAPQTAADLMPTIRALAALDALRQRADGESRASGGRTLGTRAAETQG
jgi:hypothetical protein